MTYWQSIIQIVVIILVRLSRWACDKRHDLATPLLPTWIYPCQPGGAVSCALPFMTNVTISTSISQTFLSWVAIFDLRQPMVCLSQSSYGMPGLAPLTIVSFWERCDFHVSFMGRDMSGNVWNRPLGSSMVDMGISSNIMKSPLPNVTWLSGTRSYTMTPSIDQTFH